MSHTMSQTVPYYVPGVPAMSQCPTVPILAVSPMDNNNNINYHNNIDSLRNLNLISDTSPSSPTTIQTPHKINKFAASQSSSSLEDTSHTISIASLNVRGFASSVSKFDAIIDDLF